MQSHRVAVRDPGDIYHVEARPETPSAPPDVVDLLHMTLAVVEDEQVQLVVLRSQKLGERDGIHITANYSDSLLSRCLHVPPVLTSETRQADSKL